MSGPRGASVAEVLVALVLGLVLVQVGWRVLEAQHGAVRRLIRGVEAAEAGRMVRGLLGREIRGGRPGADWIASGGDSLVARSFRATGLPCAPAPDSLSIVVARRGSMVPVPGRDSVLVLGPRGAWMVRALADRVPWPGGCGRPPGGPGERWILDRPPGPALLLRLFRSGSYHLAGGTLRYRRGDAGRQPLAPEVLSTRGSFLRPRGSGGVSLGLALRHLPRAPGANPWHGTLLSADR